MATVLHFGFEAKLYYNTGSYGTPTWTVIPLISDCQVTGTWDEADATTRYGAGVKQMEPSLLAVEIAGKIRTDEGDTTFVALADAFFGRNVVDVLVLNGASDANGSRGYRFEAKVFNWTESQNPGDLSFHEFSLKPCASENAPKRAVVASGAPVFSAIG